MALFLKTPRATQNVKDWLVVGFNKKKSENSEI